MPRCACFGKKGRNTPGGRYVHVGMRESSHDPAFEAFYRAHADHVRRLATRLVGAADADDLVQEAMLRAARHLSENGFSGEPRSWLDVVTRNLAVDHRRKTGRTTPAAQDTLIEVAGASSDEDPSDAAARADQRQRLSRALRCLPAADRSMLVRHEVEGTTAVALAAPLGITANSMRQRLLRARRILVRQYEELGGSLGVAAPLTETARSARRTWASLWNTPLGRLPSLSSATGTRGRATVAVALLTSVAAPFPGPRPATPPDPVVEHVLPGRGVALPDPGDVLRAPAELRRATARLPLPTAVPAPGQDPATPTLHWTRHRVTGPPARHRAAMAYDEQRQETVLFGGSSGDEVFGDTWTWNGSAWSRRTPAGPQPSARYGAALAYDAARRVLVLFGGHAPGLGYLNDTWGWDGTSWTRLLPPLSPSPRSQASLGYDPIRRRLVLFGGFVPVGHNAETWTWDGTTWTKEVVLDSPPVRYGATLAFDPVRGQLVMYGGMDSWPLNDTWAWDGVTWAELVPDVIPDEPRADVSVVYDRRVRALVAFNGPGAWRWAGAAWQEVPAAAAPPNRPFAAVAYDTTRSALVFFGGGRDDVVHGDMWTAGFDVPAATDPVGALTSSGNGAVPVPAAAEKLIPPIGTTVAGVPASRLGS